jgi:hypothetical protein
MLKDCIAYQVFIASPDECDLESEAVYEAILKWNATSTLRTQRILIPVRWTRNMYAMGGADPQDLINEELLRQCDILVGVFKTQLGKMRGAEREVRFFVNNDRSQRVMLFVHRDKALKEDALSSFVQEMNESMFIWRFADARELTNRLTNDLDLRIGKSLAAPYIEILRTALYRRIREWQHLDPQDQFTEKGFTAIVLIQRAFSVFQRRKAGRPLGMIDGRVNDMMRRLRPATRDLDSFINDLSRQDIEDLIQELVRFTNGLPEEEDLI